VTFPPPISVASDGDKIGGLAPSSAAMVVQVLSRPPNHSPGLIAGYTAQKAAMSASLCTSQIRENC
jgi:hypothetical protein